MIEPGAVLVRKAEIGPSLVDLRPDGFTLVTDVGPERKDADPVTVEVVGAGGQAVFTATGARGARLTIDARTWPDGAYEVRCRSPRPTGLLYAAHLPWYKGDSLAAARALAATAAAADAAKPEGFTLRMLVDMVEDLSDSPAMIVYGFVEELRALREQYQGLAYMGAGVSDKAAERHEADWNADRLPLLALHPASAGHGLNLQYGSGNQMLMLNMPWSAELYDQTIRRMHRQGQKRRTFLHLLLMRDTLDEVKFDRVVGKMTDQEAFNKYIRKV